MMNVKTICIFVVLSLFARSSASLVDLQASTFDDVVLGGDKASFVKFYAPWCGHCKRLAPIWDELADDMEEFPSVQIARIDCTVHGAVCTKYKVTGYPSLKYFLPGQSDPADYNGARELSPLTQFVKETLVSEKCSIVPEEQAKGCSDKEVKYIGKMYEKSDNERAAELKRLQGMKGESMNADSKDWLNKRINILTQF